MNTGLLLLQQTNPIHLIGILFTKWLIKAQNYIYFCPAASTVFRREICGYRYSRRDTASHLRYPDLREPEKQTVDLVTQTNLEVDSEDVQGLLNSHNQELTIDDLTEIHNQEQDIEEP
ncbi:hypothetical protein TNCV_4678111 [Trichonephila clavipes]|nr:hypothetical protein TNCV_4678111 [Trichonephila clavipes]